MDRVRSIRRVYTTCLYDVDARAGSNTPVAEMFGPMLQTLLKDRFKLKIHKETRELPVYALTVAKSGSKLQPTVPVSWIVLCGLAPPDAASASPSRQNERVATNARMTSLLVDFGRNPRAPWHATTSAILQRHGVVLQRPGLSDPRPVEDHLAGRARARPLVPLTATSPRTLAQDLADWEGQIHSWSWSSTPEEIAAAVTEARQWASDTGWPLDRPVTLDRIIQWWAFDIINGG